MAFLNETRQNFRLAGAINYAASQQAQLALPRVGYLSKLVIHVTGNMQITPGTGSAALSSKGPWSLLRRIRYAIGSGTEIFNTSGWGAYNVNRMLKLQFQNNNGETSPGYEAQIYRAGVASGANAWDFFIIIPLVPNDRDLFGLILLQAEGVITNLYLDWNSGGGAVTDFPVILTGDATAVFTGRADVWMETFTVPALVQDQAPLDRVHQVVERVDPISGTGDTTIKLLEENVYLRVLHSIELNGALNTVDVESLRFRYNLTDVPYDYDRQTKLFMQRYEQTKDMPLGTYYWDFFNQGYPNYGGDRDMINASGLAELESIIRIGSGATLGSNNNLVRTITQQLVQVSSPVLEG